MKLKFYDTRGSIPIIDPDFMWFSGNITVVDTFISSIEVC